MFRQQILPTSRIHLNIITDPGAPINVIPAHARLVVACRALEDAEFARITETVKVCVQAAAASARCTFDAEWSDPYLSMFRLYRLSSNMFVADTCLMQLFNIICRLHKSLPDTCRIDTMRSSRGRTSQSQVPISGMLARRYPPSILVSR